MNFATLKGLTIPEGVVTQIADAAGNVLWKQAPAGANVKVTVSNSGMYATNTQSMYSYLMIDGVRYNTAAEIVVPIGTVITCNISKSSPSGFSDGVYLNGTQVAYTSTPNQYSSTYSYTVTGNVDIVLSSGAVMGQYGPSNYSAYIYITET